VAATDGNAIIGVGAFDFTSVQASPGFLGDRVFVAVGSNAVDTFLFLIQTSDVVPFSATVNPPGAVNLDTVTFDSPSDLGSAGGILASSIALPSDFDPTVIPGRRTYVAWASVVGAPVDDVYRVDHTMVRKLESGNTSGIWGIAYSGTIAGGTLVAGEMGVTAPAYTLVHYSTEPQLAMPSWATSTKSPTGTAACVVGIDAADPTLVYAGTSGGESAFSLSRNGGLSFNQVGLINTDIDALHDVMPTPDGFTLLLATGCDDGVGPNDTAPVTGGDPVYGAGSSDLESLCRIDDPVMGFWERIRMSPADWSEDVGAVREMAGESIVRLSPEWDDVPALYWCDRTTGAAAGPTLGIQRSIDGGDTFTNRVAPAPIADVVVENASILYVGDATSPAVFSSTNGAWFFGLGVPAVFTTVFDLAMAPSYPEKPIPGYVLATDALFGAVIYSSDANTTWIPTFGIPSPLTTAVQVIADVDFANNSTIYAGDATSAFPAIPINATGSGIWRYVIDESTIWEQINPVPLYTNLGPDGVLGTADDAVVGVRAITGLATISGSNVLYGSYLGNLAANSGAERSLIPDIPVIASWIWDRMDIGSANGGGAAIVRFASPPNALRISKSGNSVHLWAIDVFTQRVMAYEDTMALADIEVTVPEVVEASLAEMARGWNAQFSISWNLISNATDYEVQIATDPGISNVVATSIPFGPAGPPWYVAANPLTPTLVVLEGTLVAGQDYFVRVRIRDQIPNDMIRSPWSPVYQFTIQGGEVVEIPYLAPQPMAPACGSTNAPVSPGFTWSPYAKFTRYEVQLASDAAFTDILGEDKVSTTGWKYDGTLTREVTYFWRVRAIEPTTSAWSPVCAFTVAEETQPPVEVVIPPPAEPAEPAVTPTVIWAIIAIGAILVIAVIVLIIRTRRAT
jgi:hypothetical protein